MKAVDLFYFIGSKFQFGLNKYEATPDLLDNNGMIKGVVKSCNWVCDRIEFILLKSKSGQIKIHTYFVTKGKMEFIKEEIFADFNLGINGLNNRTLKSLIANENNFKINDKKVLTK